MAEQPNENKRSEPIERRPDAAVQNLQRYLRTISYQNEQIPAPPVDGIFGDETADSVRAFQREYGLPVTGYANKETWDVLFAAYQDALFRSAQPAKFAIFPMFPENYSAKKGDRWFLVDVIQFLLAETMTIFPHPTKIARSGIYDEDTVTAVQNFQKLCKLPETGEVDKRTWNFLCETYEALVGINEAT